MRYPSPLRYPGGKGRIFDFFSSLLYENGLIGTEYAEPYAGGGGLALKLLYGGYVSKLYLNDLDPAIAAFWSACLKRPDEFCDWVKSVEVSVDSWNTQRDIYQNPDKYSWMDLAKATFFLNRTSVSGVLKGAGIIGGKGQQGKSKIGARFNRNDLCEKILAIYHYRDAIEFSDKDALTFIKRIQKRSHRTLLYMDPPYVNKGSSLYLNHYLEKDHRVLAKLVHKLNGNWLVSYDESNLILKLYTELPTIAYSLRQNTSSRIGGELMISSPSLSFAKSVGNLDNARVLKKEERNIRGVQA